MLCNNISRVLDAVRSRTLPVRVPSPSDAEICDLLQHVAEKEKITLPAEFAARVGASRRCFAARVRPTLTPCARAQPRRRTATCAARCCRWRRAKLQSASRAAFP